MEKQRSRQAEKNIDWTDVNDESLFTVHYTKSENGVYKRVQFIRSCFSWDNMYLCLVDHQGNLYFFDFRKRICCKLSTTISGCSIMHSVCEKMDYIIGTKDGNIIIVNIGVSDVLRQKRMSNLCIRGAFFIKNKNNEQMLIYTVREAILCCYNSLEKKYRLEYNEQIIILKHVSEIPYSEKIFACFSNDQLHIWSSLTFKTVRIIRPMQLKARYLNQGRVHYITTSKSLELKGTKKETKEYIPGSISTCSVSLDGKIICLATDDDFIFLISTIKFNLLKLIEITDNSCVAIAFLPYSFNCFYILTGTSDVILLDYNMLNVLSVINNCNTRQISVSNNGKFIALTLISGEVKVYSSDTTLYKLQKAKKCAIEVTSMKHEKIPDASLECTLIHILEKSRLQDILKEFGEYPAAQRPLIWFCLLELPKNKKAFKELFGKDEHPAVNDLTAAYSLKDRAVQRDMSRTVSCLLHWNPLLRNFCHLPHFVFPFLKVYARSPMLTFELVATILLNYCQLWFEFSPVEPLNYLAIVENILAEFSPSLIQYYREKHITTCTYALPLMVTAFSEVLESTQWYQLWDNILSKDPEYLIFSVVSYNMIQKSKIMSFKTANSIESFFREQNSISIKKLINCAVHLMEKCPKNINPKMYLKRFESIPEGFYPKIDNYPKLWVDRKKKQLKWLQEKSSLIKKQMEKMIVEENGLLQNLENGLVNEEYEKQIKEVGKAYSEDLSKNEDRINSQYEMLLLCQKEIQNQKVNIWSNVIDSRCRRNIIRRNNAFNILLKGIECSRIRKEIDFLKANSIDPELYSVFQKTENDESEPKAQTMYQAEYLNHARNDMAQQFQTLLKQPNPNIEAMKMKLNYLQHKFYEMIDTGG